MRLRIFTEPQMGATYDQQLAIARAAETSGFDAFFRSDHFLGGGKRGGLPGPTDTFATLAGLARETATIRLGTLVTCSTFRLPGPLAIAVAQIDAMSGGRVELGMGAGWNEAEHRAYGVPFPPVRERFDRLEEQLAIVKGLWTTPEGDKFAFDGRHYRLEESPALPKPLQRPHPPLIVGGAGKRRTPALAARFADEFNVPFHAVEPAREAVGRVREACERAGRDPSTLVISAALMTCCGEDEESFRKRAATIGVPAEALREHAAGGTPKEIVERLLAFRDIGAERIYLQVLDLDDVEHIHLLGEEVRPHVEAA